MLHDRYLGDSDRRVSIIVWEAHTFGRCEFLFGSLHRKTVRVGKDYIGEDYHQPIMDKIEFVRSDVPPKASATYHYEVYEWKKIADPTGKIQWAGYVLRGVWEDD